MKPEITFSPFSEDAHGELAESSDDEIATIQASLVIRWGSDDDLPIKLAEMILAHFREYGGDRDLVIPGELWLHHDDEELPPTAVEGDELPAWLQTTIQDYRKPEMTRLLGIIRAVESTEADSFFNEEENEHRRTVRIVQDKTLGSREELRELLEVAHDALRHYVTGADPDRAKHALAFIEKCPI